MRSHYYEIESQESLPRETIEQMDYFRDLLSKVVPVSVYDYDRMIRDLLGATENFKINELKGDLEGRDKKIEELRESIGDLKDKLEEKDVEIFYLKGDLKHTKDKLRFLSDD